MKKEPEIWRPVVGYEAYYEISSLGRVRSFDRKSHPGKILKAVLCPIGRPRVCLSINERRKTIPVCRLVLAAFRGPRPEGCEACHKDGNNANDRLSNLRWDTHLNNIRDKHRHGTMFKAQGERNGQHVLSEEEARNILNSAKRNCDLARVYDVDPSTISQLRRGYSWRCLHQRKEAA